MGTPYVVLDDVETWVGMTCDGQSAKVENNSNEVWSMHLSRLDSLPSCDGL